jgi:hypothetical protein
MEDISVDEFRKSLGRLAGQVCWGTVAGAGRGSVLSLNIGSKLIRDVPVKNPNLSDEVRNYDPEYSLFIECSWRVNSKTQVLFGAWDENDVEGPKIQGLQALVNQKIRSVSCSEPAFDLEIVFENELTLRVFCDSTNDIDAADNYALFLPHEIFIICNKSTIRKEERGRM